MGSVEASSCSIVSGVSGQPKQRRLFSIDAYGNVLVVPDLGRVSGRTFRGLQFLPLRHVRFEPRDGR